MIVGTGLCKRALSSYGYGHVYIPCGACNHPFHMETDVTFLIESAHVVVPECRAFTSICASSSHAIKLPSASYMSGKQREDTQDNTQPHGHTRRTRMRVVRQCIFVYACLHEYTYIYTYISVYAHVHAEVFTYFCVEVNDEFCS